MSRKLLFCNIGWMNHYQGITDTDMIIGGGKYVHKNEVGGEIYNFRNDNGVCYGYVQPSNPTKDIGDGRIIIEKLGANSGDDSIDGIDVVLTAYRPGYGTVVIGWYKNATVYRNKQIRSNDNFLDINNRPYGYRYKADSQNVRLLDQEMRTLKVPIARGKNSVKGGLGQSNVWYAQNLKDESFFERLFQLMNNNKGKVSKSPRINNFELNKQVEIKAINFTASYYESLGYEISSVERDNVGWDIEAKKDDIILLIEVKGLSGSIINAGLTPNEYKAMLNPSHIDRYRLCIVHNCMSEIPILSVFSYNIPSEKWIDQNEVKLVINEKISAFVSI